MLDRFLVVGLGSIGMRHVRVVRRLIPDAEITVLRHRGPLTTQVEGVDRCVKDFDEALQFAPQAAVIANPASHHLEVAIPLAKAGVHLLVEKPISHSDNRVDELVAIASERHVTLMTGYNLRFSPSLQYFRELVGHCRVGRVLTVHAEVGQYLPTWRPGVDYRNTATAKASLGGGVLLELSHEIDYLRWLFGEVASVTATLRKQSDLEMDAEDTAHLTMSFVSEGSPRPVVAYLTMDCVRQDSTRVCTVIGETGSLRWNALAGTVHLYEKGMHGWNRVFEHQDQKDETYEEEWRHFFSCIAGLTRPIVSGEDGLAVLRIVEAARRSSAMGMAVSVDAGEKRYL